MVIITVLISTVRWAKTSAIKESSLTWSSLEHWCWCGRVQEGGLLGLPPGEIALRVPLRSWVALHSKSVCLWGIGEASCWPSNSCSCFLKNNPTQKDYNFSGISSLALYPYFREIHQDKFRSWVTMLLPSCLRSWMRITVAGDHNGDKQMGKSMWKQWQ